MRKQISLLLLGIFLSSSLGVGFVKAEDKGTTGTSSTDTDTKPKVEKKKKKRHSHRPRKNAKKKQ